MTNASMDFVQNQTPTLGDSGYGDREVPGPGGQRVWWGTEVAAI